MKISDYNNINVISLKNLSFIYIYIYNLYFIIKKIYIYKS